MARFDFSQRARGVALVLWFVAGLAQSQPYPTRPIVLVSGYQTGATADGLARALAEGAGKALGQPVIVEAKPGADGMIAALDVLKAPPDGYRLLWGGAGSLLIAPALRQLPPFDPASAFTAISAADEASFFLFVSASLPVRTLRDFVDYVKARPGKVSYATGNSLGLLTFADLIQAENLDMVMVPYKGEPAAITDLIGGRVDAIFATSAPASFVKDGKLRALAVTLREHSPVLPDVPTMKEAGFREVGFGGGWFGVVGPAKMPSALVEKLNAAFAVAHKSKDVQTLMRNAGLVPSSLPVADLPEFIRAQNHLYKSKVRELGIPLQ